jgi:hypothetical protein
MLVDWKWRVGEGMVGGCLLMLNARECDLTFTIGRKTRRCFPVQHPHPNRLDIPARRLDISAKVANIGSSTGTARDTGSKEKSNQDRMRG